MDVYPDAHALDVIVRFRDEHGDIRRQHATLQLTTLGPTEPTVDNDEI